MPIATEARTGPEIDAATSTSSRVTRVLGAACLVALATLLVFAFVLTNPDERVDESTNIVTGQSDAVRLLYVHAPVAIVAYVAFSVTAFGGVMVLWRKSSWWDITAAASAEVGVLFSGLTLVTGSIWGRPIWNTWWEWGDVRLMTTLILFLIFVGYLAFRRTVTDTRVRARRSAVLGIIGAINIPIVYKSVEWWENRTLHQQSSLTDGKLEDLTLFALMLGIVVFLSVYVWLMIHRFRIGWLEHQAETAGLSEAIAERRAQADDKVRSAVTDTRADRTGATVRSAATGSGTSGRAAGEPGGEA